MERPGEKTVSQLALTLLLGGLAVCGCGRGADEAPPLDLLRRTPDEVFEHPGVIVPAPGERWGALHSSGWEKDARKTPEGHAYVRSTLQRVSLALPSDVPAGDRSIELLAWHPSKGALRAHVFLNGIDLGEIRLRPAPSPITVPAPAAAWRRGENLLELEAVPRRATADWLALAEVRYGAENRRSSGEEGHPLLAPRTGMRYMIEPVDRDRLVLEARATGPGRIDVALGLVDPETGDGDATDADASFDLAGAGSFGRTLVLPRAPGRLLRLDLWWTSPEGASLEVERLDLAGGSEHERPPIVFISIDTLAARHTSLYGYGRETTPRLEELARDSVTFESCAANAPWTLPSYLSVMTGLYPQSHLVPDQDVVRGDVQVWDHWQLAENRWTLAEMLRALGYRTAAFVDSPWISPRYRFEQGFDLFDTSARQIPKPDPHGGIELVVQLASRWLDGLAPDDPPFLFLQALDVHAPYLPTEPWKGTFAGEVSPEDARMVGVGCTVFSYGGIVDDQAAYFFDGDDEIPEEVDVNRLIAAYDEEILGLDATLGRFLDDLRERGLYDQALIVFTADHGEAFDHGFYGHSGTLYESIVKVPLIVKLPGNRHAGARVSTSVQLTDLYPTIHDLLTGQPTRAYLHGRSLLPAIEGKDGDPGVTYAEDGLIEQYMVERGGWKLIELRPGRRSAPDSVLTHPRVPRDWLAASFPELLDRPLTRELRDQFESRPDFDEKLRELRRMLQGPFYELYDLREDPGEERDLSGERPDVVAELMPLLAAEKARRAAARENARPTAVKVDMSEEDLEALRKLGYVDH